MDATYEPRMIMRIEHKTKEMHYSFLQLDGMFVLVMNDLLFLATTKPRYFAAANQQPRHALTAFLVLTFKQNEHISPTGTVSNADQNQEDEGFPFAYNAAERWQFFYCSSTSKRLNVPPRLCCCSQIHPMQ
jgi:hypothetical protein